MQQVVSGSRLLISKSSIARWEPIRRDSIVSAGGTEMRHIDGLPPCVVRNTYVRLR